MVREAARGCRVAGQREQAGMSGRKGDKALTLKPKTGGKVPGGTDIETRAVALEAHRLTKAGRGGGIVPLALPKDAKGWERLQKDAALYEPVRVTSRSEGQRGESREPDEVRRFLLDALAIKGELNPQCKAKEFCHWVVRSLSHLGAGSDLHKLAKHKYSYLMEQQRSLRWWQDRVRDLKKMSR